MGRKHRNFSKNQIDKIIELSLKGVSSRKICDALDLKHSRKSSVQRVINRYKDGEIVHSGELEDAQKRETVIEESIALDALCEHPDWTISNLAKRLRSAQRSNNQLRKVQRELFDNENSTPKSLEDIILDATKTLNKKKGKILNYNPCIAATPSTLEVMISDFQIGKITRHFNKNTAQKAMEKYGADLIKEIQYKSDRFKIEKVVLELLGDLTEDHSKHGVGSAISTDCGLSEQIHLAITCLWEYVLKPLAQLNVEVEVIGICGNHGSSTHKGMGTFKEGIYGYDYVIFKTLEKYCELSKFDKVKFNLPEGTFGHTTIYGRHVILEHGYHNNTSEKGMIDQMRKRGAQLKVHPTYWRQADKHHFICYGQGEQICNSAWFGMDTEAIEYAGVLGFAAIPSQTIVFHTEEKSEGKSTVKDIVNIQVFVDK